MKIDHNMVLTVIIIILCILIMKKVYKKNNYENFQITKLKSEKDYKLDDLKKIAKDLKIKFDDNIKLSELYKVIKIELEKRKQLSELKSLADKKKISYSNTVTFLELLNIISNNLNTIGFSEDKKLLEDLLKKLELINKKTNKEYYKTNSKLMSLHYKITLALINKKYNELEKTEFKGETIVSKKQTEDSETKKKKKEFDTSVSLSINSYELSELKKKAEILGIKYDSNIKKEELYYKIKYHNKYLDKLKFNNQEDYDKNIKEYQNSLEDYLNYQKQQNNKIDLFSIGKDIEIGLTELTKAFNNLAINEESFSNKEGFVNVDNKDDYNKKINYFMNEKDKFLKLINKIKNKNSKKYNLLKQKYNYYNKMVEKIQKNNPFELKEEFSSDKPDIDENALDFLKYIFQEIYNSSIKQITSFDTSKSDFTSKILNFFKNEVFKNDQTLIGGGILLIIISMGLYFIDVSIY